MHIPFSVELENISTSTFFPYFHMEWGQTLTVSTFKTGVALHQENKFYDPQNRLAETL